MYTVLSYSSLKALGQPVEAIDLLVFVIMNFLQLRVTGISLLINSMKKIIIACIAKTIVLSIEPALLPLG